MGIIAWIVLGAIAGYLAGFLSRVTRVSASSATSSWASSARSWAAFSPAFCLGVDPIDGALDISSIVAAVIGAVIVVWVVGMFTGRRGVRGSV